MDRIRPLTATGKMVNSYLVDGPEPILVDTGTPGHGAAILAELERLNIKPAWIVLTHADPDHIGGAALIRSQTGANLCAPAAERAYIEGRLTPRPAARRLGRRIMLGRRPPPEVDRWLEAGEKVGDLEVLASPGHTPGHVSLRLDNTLIAGDAFRTAPGKVTESFGFLTWDRAAARRSIAMLAGLGFERALVGHGPEVSDASRLLRELVATWPPPPPEPPR